MSHAITGSPLPVLRENVVAVLRYRVAREPALGVVPLRWLVSHGEGPERIRGALIHERGPPPSAAVREPLAVPHHEINVMQGTWHRRLTGARLVLFRVPMDLRHLGTVWERLAVAGNASLVGVDHHGIPEDHGDQASVLTGGDYRPAFVSPELRECEPSRYFHGVLVLRGKGPAAQDGEHSRNHRNRRHPFVHRQHLFDQ